VRGGNEVPKTNSALIDEMKSGYCEGETSFICPHILDFFSGVVN
jgi:hypothetical protein